MILGLVSYGAFFLTMALTFAIICLGLNVQWGQTGLFNVGVAGFVAVGAYVSALLTTPDAPGRLAPSKRRASSSRPALMYAFNSVNSIRSCCARLPPMRSLSFAIGASLTRSRLATPPSA